jgi:hypothetical protein
MGGSGLPLQTNVFLHWPYVLFMNAFTIIFFSFACFQMCGLAKYWWLHLVFAKGKE